MNVAFYYADFFSLFSGFAFIRLQRGKIFTHFDKYISNFIKETVQHFMESFFLALLKQTITFIKNSHIVLIKVSLHHQIILSTLINLLIYK